MPVDLLTGKQEAEAKGPQDLLAYQSEYTDGASDKDPVAKTDAMFERASGNDILQGEQALKYEQTKDKSSWGATIDVAARSFARIDDEIGSAALKLFAGAESASVVNKDWRTNTLRLARKKSEEFSQDIYKQYGDKQIAPFIPIKLTDVAAIPQSLSFSVASMSAGLAAGVPIALLPVPGARVAAWVTGSAVSGKAAYEMATYEIMQSYLETVNEETPLTPETEKQAKDYFSAAAQQYGLWEAVPEAVSNLAFVGILTKPLTKMVGKTVAGKILQKVAGLYGEEMITEAATQWGQARIEEKYGMRKPGEGQISPWQALKEVAPQTFLLTTIMGGAGAGTVAIANKARDAFIKESKSSAASEERIAQAEVELAGRINEVNDQQVQMKSQQEQMANDSMNGQLGFFDEEGNYNSPEAQGAEGAEIQGPQEEQTGEKIIYRGEGPGGQQGNYYTTDKEFARNFTQSGLDSEIVQKSIRDEDIYRPKELPFAGSEEQMTAAIEKAKGKGFKALEVTEGIGQPNSIFVIDKSVFGPKTPGLVYGDNLQEGVKPDSSAIKKFEERLNEITDLKEKAILAREAKEELAPILDMVKKGVHIPPKGEQLREELMGIPAKFRSMKGGYAYDEMMDMLNNADLGLYFEKTNDMIDFLKNLDVQIGKLDKTIDAGKLEKQTKTEATALKQRIKDIRKGIQEGKKLGKAEVKSAKDILDRRRSFIRAAQKQFGLSDKEIKSISGRDIRLMNNVQFKEFIDGIREKAEKLAERKQLENEIASQIQEKELQNVDSLRKAAKLPPIAKMTNEQLAEFGEMLEPYKQGDVFLTQRQLETVDNTDLKGIKTRREAQERLAKEAGVPIEELTRIKVGIFDKFRQDVRLASKNPLYKILIEGSHGAFIQSDLAFRNFEKKLDLLTNKARESRKQGVGQRLVPTDNLVFDYLSSEDKAPIEAQMTPEEKELAQFLRSEYAMALKYLVERKTLKTGLDNYITNLRRGFLEAFKESGLKSAITEMFDAQKQDEQTFNILDQETDQILPLEKFFQFAMKRSGNIEPTKNVAKAAGAYFRTFHTKIALDAIMPKMMIYVQAMTPMQKTPMGLEMDRSLEKFVKEWVNTKKGRKAQRWIKQGGPLDIAILSLKSFITLMDLGINIPVQIASVIGETGAGYVTLGKVKMAKGIARLTTKKGQAFLKQYEGFVGKTMWQELIDPAKNIGDKLMTVMMGSFGSSSTRMNKISLLGMITDQEYNSGQVSDERLAQIKLEIGKMRVIHGGKSIAESTTMGGVATQYKSWALPILSTVASDFVTTAKNIKNGTLKWNSGEMVRIRREAEVVLAALIFQAMLKADKDDKSFAAQLLRKAQREALTILGALDPSMWLGTPRMIEWLDKFGKSIKMILTLEKYKEKGRENELKGVTQLGKQFTPRSVQQFMPDDSKRKSRGMK